MHPSFNVFLINEKVRAIAVAYEADEKAPTTLFKSFDHTIKVDDYVVIETDTRHFMTVGKVKEVDVEVDFDNANRKIGWIVDTVDDSGHKQILKQEEFAQEAIRKAQARKKRDELRDALVHDQSETLKSLEIAGPTAGKDTQPE